MKILVLGATGKTGSILVEELLKEKYEVSVLVRNKNKIDINNTLLKVYEGNVLNHDQLAESMRGVEMVISCLGGDDNKKSDLLTQMSKSITEVMNEFNVKRLVVMSSAGIHGEFNDIISKIIVKLFFGNAIKDHKGAAEHIM
jgi:putative NADH-flavin reductase